MHNPIAWVQLMPSARQSRGVWGSPPRKRMLLSQLLMFRLHRPRLFAKKNVIWGTLDVSILESHPLNRAIEISITLFNHDFAPKS